MNEPFLRVKMPFSSPSLTNRRNALKPDRKTEDSRHPTSDIRLKTNDFFNNVRHLMLNLLALRPDLFDQTCSARPAH